MRSSEDVHSNDPGSPPSPVPSRRLRTISACQRAAAGPDFTGVIDSFSREKGHGWISTKVEGDSGGRREKIFLHISDIEGDWVPRIGDIVTFKKHPMPPRNEKLQAVHVRFVHLKPGNRECWDD
ncbi:hypothetical protein ACOME3_008982 [Neoechinorhynchus agilis]